MEKNNFNEKLLTIDDLAQKLGVSRKTIWNLRHNHILPAPIMLGTLVRWRESDIDEYLRNIR